MKFFIAAYYLIQGSSKPEWMDKSHILPDRIWSGSHHICPKMPDAWIFDWVNDPGSVQEREKAKESLGIPPADFAAMQKDFEELFERDQFGFPNVFMEADLALAKYDQYFRHVPNLKPLGFGLPEIYLDSFFEHFDRLGFELIAKNGVYQKLAEEEVVEPNSLQIGYDLLTFNGSDFCSFLCGSMEREIQEKYGIQYNQYGLPGEYEPADKLVQAIHRGEEVAEEGFWAPWLVFEPAP